MDVHEREDTNSSFIGNINPFRYRGYYYDNGTKEMWQQANGFFEWENVNEVICTDGKIVP